MILFQTALSSSLSVLSLLPSFFSSVVAINVGSRFGNISLNSFIALNNTQDPSFIVRHMRIRLSDPGLEDVMKYIPDLYFDEFSFNNITDGLSTSVCT